MTKPFGGLLAVAALAVLAGCSTFGKKIETPAVEVTNVQILSADMFSQRFKVHLKVANPNDIEVPVESIDFKLFLMGDQFGEGATDAAFTLPSRGEAEFDAMLSTDFVSALGRVVSRKGGNKLENVEYAVTGTLHLAKGFVREVPFSHKGLVDFTKGYK
ncbi:MAG: LEA type 2 family protein [Steroidobacteraceae bacterium]